MNLRQAIERMRELFPGRHTCVGVEMTASSLDGAIRHEFKVYAAPEEGGANGWLGTALSLPPLIEIAEKEAARREAVRRARDANPTDPNAAAECLTQALTEAAGPEYTAAEHERAGAKLAADVAAVPPESGPDPDFPVLDF